MRARSMRLAKLLLRPSATGRALSTAPDHANGKRVLCSLQELRALGDKGLKFPLHEPQSADSTSSTTSTTRKSAHRRRDLLTTGFVFLNKSTGEPQAFINRCPHALLELDLDDSDFFCEGFIQCKAHAAFFDPDTGICLQGPMNSRKKLRSLDELRVEVTEGDVVLLPDQKEARFSMTPAYDDDAHSESYRREKQLQLATALASRSNEVEDMQRMLHEKTMARLQQFKQQDEQAAAEKATRKPRKPTS